MQLTRPIWWTLDTVENHPDWEPMYTNKIDRNVGFTLLHQSFLALDKYERLSTYGKYSYKHDKSKEP